MASKYALTSSYVRKGIKFVFYGPEGIGKSTLASKLPSPIFIDTEGSTDHMVVCRYPRPRTWEELLDMVDDASQQKLKTIVIDTADWAERLCTESLCRTRNWKGIEDLGYGKGYVYQAEEFGKLLDKMTKISDMGINVGFCAHAQLRKIEAPEEAGAYDHWEMKLAKKIGPMVKEWADLLIFCNYKVMVIHGNNPMEKNHVKGGKRIMYTSHHPVWDAKNRFGLADELPLDYESIRSVFERNDAPEPEAPAEPKPKTKKKKVDDGTVETGPLPDTPFTGPEEGPAIDTPIANLRRMMNEADITDEQLRRVVADKGHFPEETPIEEYPEHFINKWCIAHFELIKKMIKESK